jgi:1-pyrroline-5-carboxylate dehydrogenase
VVWKPAESASLGAHLAMQLLREAGLPDAVVNVVYGPGREIGQVALAHRDLAAVHFTGSTPRSKPFGGLSGRTSPRTATTPD